MLFRPIGIIALLLPLLLQAQKIQYSRQTFPYSFADETQLAADVGGYHHVLRFKMNNKPQVYIFNSQLEHTRKVDVGLEVKEASDIQIIPMQGYYYLYSHLPGSPAHYIYKVSGSGEVEDKTPALEKLMDSLIPKSKATYQLQNQNNQLALLSHSYFNELKKVGSTIVLLNEGWSGVHRSVVLYPFDREKETLQQVLLSERNLFVLKTGMDVEKGNTLQVIKGSLHSDSLLLNTFTTSSYLYHSPSMLYSILDASLLVFATMRSEPNARLQPPATFISRLDDQLNEIRPVTLHKTPARRNIIASFLLIANNKQVWMTPFNQVIIRRTRNQTIDFQESSFNSPSINLSGASTHINESQISHGQPTSVKFTVLNEKDMPVSDTVIENKGSYFDLQPRPHAQFTINKTACLLFLQNFSAKQKGLVLVNAGKSGRVRTTAIPVFDRYEYFIPQTQAKKDYFILPYRNKKEMGLVKVTIDNNEAQQ
jgi:hypothetical protein